jgi:anthranilate synthase component 2
MRLLLIDHQDSFTHNLADAFRQLGAQVMVVDARHARLDPASRKCWTPGQTRGDDVYDAIVLSPGPGRPRDYPQTVTLLQQLPTTFPVLGVCLGMQLINEWSGGETVHAPTLMHGKVSAISHVGRGVFGELATPCMVARYHSLMCTRISSDWEVTAWSADDVPMAIQHRHRPWLGVQFHPESFLTPDGATMLHNWMRGFS